MLPLPAWPTLQFEQAAKQESQRIQNLMEDGSDPDVKDVQVCVRFWEGGCIWAARRGCRPHVVVAQLAIPAGVWCTCREMQGHAPGGLSLWQHTHSIQHSP